MANVKRGIRRQFNRLMQRKLVMLYVVIVLAFLFLIGRVAYINAASGDKYAKIVLDQQQYDSRTIPFKRGDILDRNGTKLATNERVYNVILDSQALLDKEDYMEPTTQAVETCFGVKASEVKELAEENPTSRYLILKKKVDYNTAHEFELMDEDSENYPNIHGIWLEEDYVRTYPYDSLASDVIGFTVDGNEGSNGIEAYYNSTLNGTDGREYGYLDSDSVYSQTVKEPEDGSTVVSTIDLQVQYVVEKYIQEFNEEHKNAAREGEGSTNTAVMVMNPQNGEILAEASYPNYDLNNPRDLSAYYSESQLEEMTSDERLNALNSLWNNFCVSDTFEPGSTVKPFTIAAGLELGTLGVDDTFYCGGSLTIADYTIHCSNRNGHGTMNLQQALENSCNVALMQIADDMGAEGFARYQSLFGFGQSTGIDLYGEAHTESLVYSESELGPTELATNAFGQGFNVTMTQLAAAYCSLINGGYYYKPHIVKQIQDENGNVTESKDPVLVRRTVSQDTSDILKEYMLGVVQEGTGRQAAVEGYDVGGKTGTAEKLPRGEGNYVVSFIGYAPQENPQVMVYVVIDEPNAGDQASAEFATTMASGIMEEIFPYLGIAHSEDYESSEYSSEEDEIGDYDTGEDETDYYDTGDYDTGEDGTENYDTGEYIG